MNIKQGLIALGTTVLTMGVANVESASAITITLEGDQYEISTISSGFNDVESQLESQPWWGSEELAKSASDQVNTQLGTPNVNPLNVLDLLGPYFAFEKFIEVSGLVNTEVLKVSTYNTLTNGSQIKLLDVPDLGPLTKTTYAVAQLVEPPFEQVPEPVTILGTTIALGIGTALKKRQKAQDN